MKLSNSQPDDIVGDDEPANSNSPMDDSMANLCSVCFASPPDSVYMECGHGGICYQCALDIWRTSEECYLCRKVDWNITK